MKARSSLAVVVVTVLAGCPSPDSLVLEQMGTPAFDPLRWDPGPEPPRTRPLPAQIVFGITPFYSPARQAPALERMRAYLEQELGLPVMAEVAPTYEDVVVRLESGAVDVAQLSPYAFVKARQRIQDLLPLATAVAQGSTTYASYLVVARDAPYQGVADLRGKKLGFTDRWSTSGFLMPAAFLKARGFDPHRDFEVVWLGSHDRALDAVKEGTVEAAAVSSDTVVTHRAVGLGGPVRILAKPGRIPYDAVVVRATMDPWLVWRLRKAILTLSMHVAEGAAVLEDYNLINGFMPIPEGHYQEVVEMARALENGRAARDAQR